MFIERGSVDGVLTAQPQFGHRLGAAAPVSHQTLVGAPIAAVDVRHCQRDGTQQRDPANASCIGD